MEDVWKKLAIGLGIMFLPFSWTELQFSFLGTTAEATVTHICELPGRVRSLSIEYRFAEPSGRQRTEEDRLPPNSPRPAIGNKIDVEYLAGPTGQSRLLGNSKMCCVYLFLVLVFGGISVANETLFCEDRVNWTLHTIPA